MHQMSRARSLLLIIVGMLAILTVQNTLNTGNANASTTIDADKTPDPTKTADLPPQFANTVKWEELRQSGIITDKLVRLRRAKVPGGWFVIHGSGESRTGWFYPDPDHSWPGTSLR